jgi:hypothetical protein
LRKNRRPNARRLKSLRLYSIAEAAEALEVHRNTIWHWLKSGLSAMDQKRPVMVRGADLKDFLSRRQSARKRKLKPGQAYCVKCRKPQDLAEGIGYFTASSLHAGSLAGFCPECGTVVNRRVSVAGLAAATGNLDVQIARPISRLTDTAEPRVNCHLEQES